ncbi:MAG TPA: hypothetical protein VN372_04295 [Methanospirillum sp.]|nr:hypothetical protein [Methanospirillum sp.]
MGLRRDLEWIRRVTRGHIENTKGLVNQLTTDDTIPNNRKTLVSQFNMSKFFDLVFPKNFILLNVFNEYRMLVDKDS